MSMDASLLKHELEEAGATFTLTHEGRNWVMLMRLPNSTTWRNVEVHGPINSETELVLMSYSSESDFRRRLQHFCRIHKLTLDEY